MIMVAVSFRNEMTTPNGFHDVTTVTEDLAVFIISNLLLIDIFTKYFSPLIFLLLQ